MTTSTTSYPTKSPLSRLFTLLRPDRADIGSVVVFSVLHGALLLATPVAVQALVNNVAFGATAPSIVILAGLLSIGLITGATILAVQTWIVEILQRRIFVRLFADLSERLRRICWEVRDKHYNPELVNRFFDVVTIQKASSELLLGGIGTVLSILVGLIVIAFYHPLLLVMGGALFTIILIVFFAPLSLGSRTAIRESVAKYAAAAWLEEIARHPMTFRVTGSEALVRARSEELARQYVDTRRTHYRVVFSQIVAALGLQVLAGTAVLGLGGWLVVQGELTLGQLVAAELIVAVVVQGVAKLGKHAETFYDLVAAVDKVGKLTDLDVESEEDPITGHTRDEAPAELEVRNLMLRPRGTSPADTVSFRAEPGESLAVTGPNGIGKSFLMETIYGLRTSHAGSVVYDGKNLADLRLGQFRQEVGLAAEPDLFEGTILENLTLGREDITLDEIHEVLESLGLLEEINWLPESLQTQLSPTGTPLSPGQASRVVIARMLLAKPRLLLIDRLLDSLSKRSLRAVLSALKALKDRCTVVIVTNDESVAAACERRVELGSNAETQA